MGVRSFRRQARLLKPSEFRRVFDKAVVSSDAYFRVFARVGEGARSRLGVGVSRKVSARATERNRIRRIIRESFRLNHPFTDEADCQARSPVRDYVVLAALPAAGERNAILGESLLRHWDAIDRKLGETGSATRDSEE